MPLEGRREVLVVDDDREICQTLKEILSPQGMRVFESSNLSEAERIIDSNPLHLILLDISLNGESGFDLLRRRREHPKLSQVPIAILTGFSDQETVTRAIGLGAADFIVKPFTVPVLIRKIKKIFRSQQFLTRTYERGSYPKLNIKTEASIVEANEAVLVIESPIKLAPETKVHLDSKLLREWGCSTILTKTSRHTGRAGMEGNYINDVILSGLSERIAQRIRKAVRYWK